MNSRFLSKLPRVLNKKIIIAVVAAGLGIALISSLAGSGAKADDAAQEQTLQYVTQLEQSLEELVSSIDGVGSVKIMLTLKSGEQYIVSTAASTGGAYTANIPEIQGVVVLCVGADSPVTQEKIVEMLKVVLNVRSDNIYVSKLSVD